MRRILPPRRVRGVAQGVPAAAFRRTARADWLAPGVVTDRSDPKLAHIDGLNLSRAWMLEGIASGLPPSDRARRRAARRRDAPRRGRAARRDRRALRGRALARDVRRLPDLGGRTAEHVMSGTYRSPGA